VSWMSAALGDGSPDGWLYGSLPTKGFNPEIGCPKGDQKALFGMGSFRLLFLTTRRVWLNTDDQPFTVHGEGFAGARSSKYPALPRRATGG
jgi:hypothetical protein